MPAAKMPSVPCLCLLLATCLSVGHALESSKGEDGYETFPSVPGSSYKLNATCDSWADAEVQCQAEDATSHLIVLNSQEEADVVKELFTRLTNEDLIFAGITDWLFEGNWNTVTGHSLSSTGWNKWELGQPSGGTLKNCGVVDKAGFYLAYTCQYALPFICEKPVA